MGVTYINPYQFGFSPLSLAPLLWFDASDSNSITSSGGKISQWNDLSGNAKHAVQATSAKQPSYVTNVQNGKAVVRYGSTMNLRSSVGSKSQPVVIFYVVRITSSSTAYRSMIYASDSFTGSRIETLTANGLFYVSAGTQFAGASATNGNTYIVQAVLNSTSSSLTINTSATNSDAGTTGIINVFDIGRNDSNNFQGDYCEIVAFNRTLSANESTDLRNYMNEKWAVY